MQDFLLVENKNITNNNILTSILFGIKRNDIEGNADIDQNIKILQASVVDYAMILKDLEKCHKEKKDIETTIQEITREIEEINIKFTASNNAIQRYEWNFSRLLEKNNREIIILQKNIEELKEQIKTEREKITNLKINNKEKKIFINDNYNHSDEMMNRKIIDLNQQKLLKIKEMIDINEQEMVIKERQIVVLETEIKTNKNKIDDNFKKTTDYKGATEKLEKAKTQKFEEITLLNNIIKNKLKEFKENENTESERTQNLLVKDTRRINLILTEFYNIQKNNKIIDFFDKVQNTNIFPYSITLLYPETMSKDFNLAQIMNKIIFTPLKQI